MLSRQEYQSYDLIGLSQLVAKGELSPVETVEIAIREIEAINPAINAVVVRQFEIALGELKHRKDKPRFIGMPYLDKDLHAPGQGLPLAYGSRLL
jgi:amidase